MKTVQVEAGTIRYSDQGTGKTIVFLHGALSNGNTWRKVVPILSLQFRCIVPDLPLGGHSIPLHPEANLAPTDIAVIIKQMLDALQLDNVVLVGNDTGGAYAQVFATLYPDSISHLVLSNTDAFEVFPPKAFALLQMGVKLRGFTWVMAQLFRIKPLLKTSLVLGLLSHSTTKEELAELYVRSFIVDKGIRADFTKVAKSWSTEYTQQAAKKLRQFHKPVLVLWGADDYKLFPLELGRRVHAIFPNATFHAVNHSLTYVQEDQPQAFTKELTAFLGYNR